MKFSQKIARRKQKLLRSFEKIQFNILLNKKTQAQRTTIIAQAEIALKNARQSETENAFLTSPDPLVSQGYALRQGIFQTLKDLYKNASPERILIQVPDSHFSPAGYSIFTNLTDSFNYIGIPTRILQWDESIEQSLKEFAPTLLLTSDHASYLGRIDWNAVAQYKKKHAFRIGLTTSLEEYENTSLLERLTWAKKHGVDFFYSFRDPDYVHTRFEYQPYFDADFPILFLPFGANILHYYPAPGITRDLNYVLIASRKREHIAYLKDITHRYWGFIDGPGWNHVKGFTFNRDRDRYIYARAKVGLNIHLPEQLDWACELNERTYQLAACGVPQLIDHPKLLEKHFSKDAMFIANNPKEYTELFIELHNHPTLGQEKALIAQQEVFSKHTTLHRAASFIEQLSKQSFQD